MPRHNVVPSNAWRSRRFGLSAAIRALCHCPPPRFRTSLSIAAIAICVPRESALHHFGLDFSPDWLLFMSSCWTRRAPSAIFSL
jgi:hypothetical protein